MRENLIELCGLHRALGGDALRDPAVENPWNHGGGGLVFAVGVKSDQVGRGANGAAEFVCERGE